jgi:DNA-binding helix-turn-helix protein
MLLKINYLNLSIMITKEKILENISKIRVNKKITQKSIAGFLEIEQGSYSLLERGERDLTIDRLLQIAIFFKMDVVDIITYPNKGSYNKENEEDIKAILQIELKKDKKDQVMKLIFGDNNLEILNK